jgi:hypothetical protein
MLPIVQAKLLGTLDASVILGPAPLHVVALDEVVTEGVGVTVTVMVKAAPTHEPVVAVGVTKYSTVPGALLTGFVKTWLIVEPLAALAPVMPPVIFPIVQAKLLAAVDVRAMFVLTPLQIDLVEPLLTAGFGFTVTLIVKAAPTQPSAEVGVTR